MDDVKKVWHCTRIRPMQVSVSYFFVNLLVIVAVSSPLCCKDCTQARNSSSHNTLYIHIWRSVNVRLLYTFWLSQYSQPFLLHLCLCFVGNDQFLLSLSFMRGVGLLIQPLAGNKRSKFPKCQSILASWSAVLEDVVEDLFLLTELFGAWRFGFIWGLWVN